MRTLRRNATRGIFLNVHADTDISDELSEKIFAFVDREAGRDAPLSPEDEALVRDLLEKNPAARALAEEFRATEAGLQGFFDAVARAASKMSVPEALRGLNDAHGAERKGRAVTDKVVPFDKNRRKRHGPMDR